MNTNAYTFQYFNSMVISYFNLDICFYLYSYTSGREILFHPVIILPWPRSFRRLHFNRLSGRDRVNRESRSHSGSWNEWRRQTTDTHTAETSWGRDTGTRQNTQNARSARGKSHGEHNGYLYYRSRESPGLRETPAKSTTTATSQPRLSGPNWSRRSPLAT